MVTIDWPRLLLENSHSANGAGDHQLTHIVEMISRSIVKHAIAQKFSLSEAKLPKC